MDLKVGDLVAFKKYEDMTDEERVGISKEDFPAFGKVERIFKFTENIKIKGSSFVFPEGSIDYVICKAATDDVHVGDEVLIKATIHKISGNHVSFSWFNNSKDNIVKVLKRKEPDRFIVKEDYYGMYIGEDNYGIYIGTKRKLVSDKSEAKIYTSRYTANEDAADMHLNAWEVIKYGD